MQPRSTNVAKSWSTQQYLYTGLLGLRFPWRKNKWHKSKADPATCHGGVLGERRYSAYSFLASALDGVSGQRHAPAVLYPWERIHGTHWMRGWVGPRAGLDAEARRKTLDLCRRSNTDCPVRSQTLAKLPRLIKQVMYETTAPVRRELGRPKHSTITTVLRASSMLKIFCNTFRHAKKWVQGRVYFATLLPFVSTQHAVCFTWDSMRKTYSLWSRKTRFENKDQRL
jgi:hypothetical protein